MSITVSILSNLKFCLCSAFLRFDSEEECRDTCEEPSGSVALNEVRVRQAGNGLASLLPAVIQVSPLNAAGKPMQKWWA